MRHVEFSGLTFELIHAALIDNPTCVVPIYSEVLLDSIEASFVSDVRRSMLYAAIAVEVMASTRTEEEFAHHLQSASPDLRIIELEQAGGLHVSKDPVFDELRG